MNRTKLVLIEGIPGSGKTTTARYAAAWLGEHGFAAQIGQIAQARLAQFLAEWAG